jgi:hypothetical protein
VQTLITILGSALLAGIISPIVLAWLQHQFIWRTQRTAEARKLAFDEAITAISMFEADALNSAGGGTAAIRQETKDQMQKALALVEAFFSQNAFDAFQKYTLRDLSKVPSENLNQLRTKAIKTLATEL